jgi:hypothetical protein
MSTSPIYIDAKLLSGPFSGRKPTRLYVLNWIAHNPTALLKTMR